MVLKPTLMQFATFIPAMVGFHLLGRFWYHSVAAWIPGCVVGLAIAGGLWLYYCIGPGFRVGWALGTLSISTVLWFSFLVGAFRARFILDHYQSVSTSDVTVLALSVAVIVWLSRVLAKRNRQAHRFDKRKPNRAAPILSDI
jgi:hypothetical protein